MYNNVIRFQCQDCGFAHAVWVPHAWPTPSLHKYTTSTCVLCVLNFDGFIVDTTIIDVTHNNRCIPMSRRVGNQLHVEVTRSCKLDVEQQRKQVCASHWGWGCDQAIIMVPMIVLRILLAAALHWLRVLSMTICVDNTRQLGLDSAAPPSTAEHTKHTLSTSQ